MYPRLYCWYLVSDMTRAMRRSTSEGAMNATWVITQFCVSVVYVQARSAGWVACVLD